MEDTNRRWLLNGRRAAAELPRSRGFLEHVDILLTYRQQLAEEIHDVDRQLQRLWGERASVGHSPMAGDQPT